jgi:hypothetical protein
MAPPHPRRAAPEQPRRTAAEARGATCYIQMPSPRCSGSRRPQRRALALQYSQRARQQQRQGQQRGALHLGVFRLFAYQRGISTEEAPNRRRNVASIGFPRLALRAHRLALRAHRLALRAHRLAFKKDSSGGFDGESDAEGAPTLPASPLDQVLDQVEALPCFIPARTLAASGSKPAFQCYGLAAAL